MSHHFHNVLHMIVSLELEYLRQPTSVDVPTYATTSGRFYSYFKFPLKAFTIVKHAENQKTHIHTLGFLHLFLLTPSQWTQATPELSVCHSQRVRERAREIENEEPSCNNKRVF
ncbi:hypothetical protein RJT34_15450 [Clitoria ternatea]|uniref:Uncharacterized protein n=1 Tax=Clitoria ternatea TaxID=43366 RepID=A0AAN9J8C4_CLITE